MQRRVRTTFIDGTPHLQVEAQPGADYQVLGAHLAHLQSPPDLYIAATTEPILDATATIDWATHERKSVLYSKLCFLLLKACRDRYLP